MNIDNGSQKFAANRLPPAIEAALARADDLSLWIATHHPDDVPATLNARLAAPYFAICMDHREAILLLLAHDSRSAALALWRSVYEALISGQWAVACADEVDFERIASTHSLPKFETMVKQLDSLGQSDPAVPTYRKTKQALWGPMSEFAHGGLAQLSRWTSPESGIGSRHPDGEILNLIQYVNLYGLLACLSVSDLAGVDTAAHQAKVQELLALSGHAEERAPGT